jgi:hypothetical protein
MKYSAAEVGEAKRSLVLDLMACRDILASGADPTAMVTFAQVSAIRLTQAGVDWRHHKVRSKSYKGLLGGLYDEFKPYRSTLLIEV